MPSFAECVLAVDTLAQIHAHWWEHPRLGADIGCFLTPAQVEKLAQDAASNYERLATAVGDRLSPEHRRIYAQLIATFPRPWLRLMSPRGLTLTHGDAHVWNFLYPRTQAGRAILIDWQLWHAHIGPRDLAYMMTLSWRPERRAQMEEKLVRRYHQSLTAGGVKDYDWEQCWTDYRWSAIRNLFVPAWQWQQGMDTDLCWDRTLRGLHAFADLNCAELIEG
jgi:thiamine kinase-like enzyme